MNGRSILLLLALLVPGVGCASSGDAEPQDPLRIVRREPCEPDALRPDFVALVGERTTATFRFDRPIEGTDDFTLDLLVTDFRDEGLVADLGRLDAQNRFVPMLLSEMGLARPLLSRPGAIGETPTTYWFDPCAIHAVEAQSGRQD